MVTDKQRDAGADAAYEAAQDEGDDAEVAAAFGACRHCHRSIVPVVQNGHTVWYDTARGFWHCADGLATRHEPVDV